MLERLNFEMEEQTLAAAVVVRGRQVFFACWHGEAPAGGPSWRPLENGRRFLRRLERVHLSQWKKSYRAESPEDAVSPWQLSLSDGGVRRVIKGNAYPENWAAFVDVMNELPGLALPKVNQVEVLQLLYEGALAPVLGNVYAPRQSGGTLVEKLVVNRGKHILILTRHKQGFGTERHAFDSVRNVPLLLKRVDASLSALSALPEQPGGRFSERDGERLELRFMRRTGEERQLIFGARSTWPECLRALLREITVLTYDVKSELLQNTPQAPSAATPTVPAAQHQVEKEDGEEAR